MDAIAPRARVRGNRAVLLGSGKSVKSVTAMFAGGGKNGAAKAALRAPVPE